MDAGGGVKISPMSVVRDSESERVPAASYAAGPSRRGEPFLRRPVLYPTLYTGFVFLGAMDIMLTWVILHDEGVELNILADWIIRNHNLLGVVLFKFSMVVLVVAICEIVGRHNERIGRKLAKWAIVLGAFPVLVGAFHVFRISLALWTPAPAG